MLGISIRAESAAQGVSQMNDAVNVMEFFSTQIVPELQDTNHAARPIVKASAIKFVSTFRNQFTTEHLTALMPLLISHLASPSVVVHTYAAFAIEKILTVKVDVPGGPLTLKFGAAELKPFLEPLFTSLFVIVDNEQLNENQYVMKSIMRTLSVANEDVIPVTPIVLEKLTTVLGRVAKNPRNPQFNHYMFESIAVLVRSVCSKQPEVTSSFEGLLFPPFQMVLQLDVSEFTPYVFQVLAQLLEYRPCGSGLGEAYTMLFPPLLTPALWERKGNVPALVRLLRAYLGKAGPELEANGHLMPLLGIFQKLLSVKTTEVSSFDLLCSLIVNIPLEALQPTFKTLFDLILKRLQHGKTPRYVRLATHFFALFIGKFGSQLFFDELNSIQQGLGSVLIIQIWAPRLQAEMPARMEAKVQIVGLSRLLCDTPALISDANGRQVWSHMAAIVVSMLTSAGTSFVDASAGGDDALTEVEISYDSAYSNLYFAKKPVDDPFVEISDPALLFLQSLQTLSSTHPGCIQPLIQEGLQSDRKLSAGLDSMLTKAGIRLV
jgi:exportin-2 (importin alpha re-exporter)